MIKKTIGILTAIAFILNSFNIIYASLSNPQTEDYTVKNNVNMETDRIEQGDRVRISIDISENSIKTSDISSADDISIVSVDGSFGSPQTESILITSKGSEYLKYTINFKEAPYSGSGSTISFKIKYNSLNITSDKITLYINECSERDSQENGEEINTPSSKQPYVEISRSAISSPIKANEEFTIKLILKNRGSARMKRPVMTLSLPDSINLLEGMGNIQIPDIDPGTSRNITLKFKASDYIQQSSESIDISLNYNYDTGTGELSSASYSDRILVPMAASQKAQAPVISISRGNLSAPVSADSEFILPITVKNSGQTTVIFPVLTISLNDELIPLDDSSTTELSTLEPGKSITKNIKLKTKKIITNPAQEITADIKYSYISEKETISANESTKLIIPAITNDEKGSAPLLHITADTPEKPLNSGTSFNIKLTINNIGDTDIKAGVINFDGGESVILTDKTSSINTGAIKAGGSKEIILKGKTASKLDISTLTINGDYSYKYDSGEENASAQETIKINLSAVPSKEKDEEEIFTASATPNLIVKEYSYGGVPIANGSMFDFNVSFVNTSSSTAIENVVMSVEPDSGLSIHSDTNTYHYDKIGASAEESRTIGMQVLPSAETGSVKLTINFSYEYVENKERKQVSSSQNVSIPVYKPDKLEITLEPLPTATAGQEQTVVLNYVNKGKGELSNVKAEITGDVTAVTSVQNLGNFESGKSGTISFIVIPETPGEANFTVTVSYEDANMEQKTLEFPCKMTVEEYIDDSHYPEDDSYYSEEPSSHKGIIIIISSLSVIAIVIVIILLKRRKKKSANTVNINWEDDYEDKGLD